MMTQQEPTHGPWIGAAAVLLVLLIGTGMFYYQFYYLPAAIGPPHVPQNVDIYITAVQWAFMINGTIDTHTTPVIVHVGDNVTFHLNATFLQDHSFSEHGFFIQGIMDTPVAIPAGQQVVVKIVPTQPGDYTIICTIFCGTGHADMHGMLEVLP
jgi:heme/copper-type cytochrome/quinol oxidase subunit 2